MLSLLLFIVALSENPGLDLVELRTLFFSSEKSKKHCQELTAHTASVNEGSPAIEMGYKGMAHMMTAKHKKSPFKKLKHFNKGKKWLTLSLAKDPNSIEIRFLRLTVQENLPFFLGYRGDKEEDRLFVETHLDELPKGLLKEKIVEYLNKT